MTAAHYRSSLYCSRVISVKSDQRPGSFCTDLRTVSTGLLGLWTLCCLLSGALIDLQGQAVSTAQADSAAASKDSALSAARQSIEHGDFKTAEPILREYIRGNERSAEAEFLLGFVLFRLDRPKESLAEYTRAASLNSPSAEDLKNIAEDYVLLDDYSDADKWMLRSVQMNAKDAESWYALGRIRYTEQRFQDAVACFEKALGLAPKSVKAADNLGLAYEGLNRTEDAMDAFRRALDWQKDAEHPSEQPMLNLASVFVEQGKLDDALPLLMRAEAIAPKNSKIREQLGQLYLKKERLNDAQREFEAAVADAPESAAYHFLLGRVYHRQGQDEKAKAEFERAAALNGTHSTPQTY
jgi:tetratricopeptide (TPR) repeat protein